MIKDLKDIFKKFNTEKKCIEFLVQQRWNGVPTCPHCGSQKSYVIDNGKRYKCGNNQCYKKYSVTVGTVMHSSNIPLTTWMPAIYIISAHKKGISSVQLAKDLGVTQKTAWFMLHRIRESLKDKNSRLLKGTIEIDETYLGKKFRSDYKGLSDEEAAKLLKKGKGKSNYTKGSVLGMAERGGKIVVKAFSEINSETAQAEIKAHVEAGSNVYTDSSGLYRAGLEDYNRGSVRHNARPNEWAKGDIHVNTMESFWGTMKRAVYGTWHQISYKHLQRYCDECAYRSNTKHITDGNRFEMVLTQINGKLPYKVLINAKDNKEESNQSQA